MSSEKKERSIVISEFLSFVSSKKKEWSEKELLDSLQGFYSKSDANDAFKKLLQALPRKAYYLKLLNTVDEPNVFKVILQFLDMIDKKDLPLFVCRNLSNIPSVHKTQPQTVNGKPREHLLKEHFVIKKQINDVYNVLYDIKDNINLISKEGISSPLPATSSKIRQTRLSSQKRQHDLLKSQRTSNKKKRLSSLNRKGKGKKGQQSRSLIQTDVSAEHHLNFVNEDEEIQTLLSESAVYALAASEERSVNIEGPSTSSFGHVIISNGNENEHIDIMNSNSVAEEPTEHDDQPLEDCTSSYDTESLSEDEPTSSTEDPLELKGTEVVILDDDSEASDSESCCDEEELEPPRKVYKNRCSICTATFPTKQKLKKHCKIHSVEDYRCPLCAQRFLAEEWFDHVNSCEEGSRFTKEDIYCSICNMYYANPAVLKYHLSFHEETRDFECLQCKFRFHTQRALESHFKSHVVTPKNIRCPFCPKYSLPGRIEEHIRSHTGDKPYKCKFCGLNTTSSGRLKKHVETHANGPRAKFSCEECGNSYNTYDKISLHIQKAHNTDNPLKCEVCGEGYETGQKLDQHYQEEHCGQLESYPCPYSNCNFRGKNAGSLGAHINVHTKSRPFRCNFCDFAANHKSYLTWHVRSHHAKVLKE